MEASDVIVDAALIWGDEDAVQYVQEDDNDVVVGVHNNLGVQDVVVVDDVFGVVEVLDDVVSVIQQPLCDSDVDMDEDNESIDGLLDESDDDHQEKEEDAQWNPLFPADFHLKPFNESQCGSTFRVPANAPPPCVLSFFHMFVGEDDLKEVVRNTNMYAAIQRAKNADDKRRREWKPLTVRELCTFLGLLIVFGIHKLPSFVYYWSTSFIYSCPQFAAVMSLKRFTQIKRFLHLSDPMKAETCKMDKLRPLLDAFALNCRRRYHPKRKMAVDEMMVGSKHKYAGFRVRMPLKPTRDGYRIDAICEARSGYLFAFKVYEGSFGVPVRQTPLQKHLGNLQLLGKVLLL